METKICKACGAPFAATLENFYRQKQNSDGLTSYCKTCWRTVNRKRYNDAPRTRAKVQSLRAKVAAFKLEKGCADCGYKAHPAALEFDHLPGFQKLNEVNRIVTTGNEEKTFDEIKKCEVVCANCHRIRTASRPMRPRILKPFEITLQKHRKRID